MKLPKSKLKEILKTPKGTRDILPEEAFVWQKIEEKARDIVEYYGFKAIKTPHFEHTEIFEASLGEATDIIEKQMYSFKTKGGDALTLRPEGTVPVMRSYIEHGMRTWPQPVRLYYNGSFFRHERPQRGRFREFSQFGLETVGDGSAASDAMIIRMLTLILSEIGIKKVSVRINTLGDRECRGEFRKELLQYLRKKANYLCKDCKNRIKTNPLRVLDCDVEECREITESAPQMIEYVCSDCKSHFKEVLEFLDELGTPYLLDHRLVRGLDYYSRTVFEIMLDDEKMAAALEGEKDEILASPRTEDPRPEPENDSEDSQEAKQSLPASDFPSKNQGGLALAGGGRYDYLAEVLGAKAVPAVGGAIGIDRVADIIMRAGINFGKERQPKIFLIQLGTHAKRKSLSLMEDFRKAHIAVAQSFSRDSITSQLKIASRIGVDYALILGQKEVMDEEIIVRSMKDGTQETIAMDKLLEYVKKKLKG